MSDAPATAAAPSVPTGVSAESPTATPASSEPAPEAPKSFDKAAMLERIRSSKAEKPTQVEEGPAPESGEPAETAAPEAEQAEAKKESESVPMEAFKKRLQDEKRKREELTQKVNDSELSISKRDQAIELLKGEVRRLAEALQQGSGWDERDEQIRAYEFAEQVRQLQTDLESKHQQALAEAEQRMRLEGSREQVRGFFQDALQKHGDLVGLEELRAACKKQMGDNPDLPLNEVGRMVGEIADRIAQQRLEYAKGRVGAAAEKPPAPALVNPGSQSRTGYEYTPNAEGMRRWLAARKQAR